MNSFVFQKCIGVAATLSCLTGLMVVAPTVVHAQTVTFGSVDVDQVAQNSKETSKNADTFKALGTRLQGIYNKMGAPASSALFLTETEFNELAGLYQKDPATDAEKKRIGELETLGDQRQGDFNRLQSTKTLTPEETKRYNDLKDRQAAGANNVASLGQSFKAQMDEKGGAQRQQLLKDIRAAIAEVAKAKSMSVVFDSNVALYTANDITPDVIKQINK